MRFSLRNNILIYSLFILSWNLFSQPTTTERPRLVVGIMIDGLQQKHIDMLPVAIRLAQGDHHADRHSRGAQRQRTHAHQVDGPAD